ncbi:type 1 glutamine amidotransferase domain-containing protein [Nakamurella sp.]|uniref:type 1 glutamine amidotransferase domain-containing protein n=1 Tax=Nakamurella sp. TaxID=1869182 RepID=UPI003B3A3EFB
MTGRRARRVAFLMTDGFDETEFGVPYDRLRRAGHEPVIVGPVADSSIVGKHGADVVPVALGAAQATVADFDAVVIPGGHSPDRLRIDRGVMAFLRAMIAADRPVAAICHGPWLLVEADAVRGRRLTGWASVRTDVRNAGGVWVDAPVVRDGPIVTSRRPDDSDVFADAILAVLDDRADDPDARSRGSLPLS